MSLSNCMDIVNRMDQEDQDAVLDRLEKYQAMGMAPERAQVAAATDVLEGLKAERAEFVQLVEEQHPDYANRQVNFEVAPDPNDAGLLAAWRSLEDGQRLAISDKVARALTPKVLKLRQVSGQVLEQFGSYLDDTNPSFALKTSSDLVSEISADLGYVLSQDSMMNLSDEAFPGSEEHGAVIVDLGEVDLGTVERVYDQLRQAIPEIGGQSFAQGWMTIINMQQYSGITTDALIQKVDALVGQKYTVRQTNIYASFIEKDNYRDYQNLDGRGSEEAQANLRAGLDRLRGEAASAIRQELEAAGVKLEAGGEEVSLSSRDLFGGFANKGTTITQEKVINSRGETRQVKRGNVNSDGKKITGTRQGLENFWNWFDDSWAVDDKGIPLVLYHSSGHDIDTLKTGRESVNNYGLLGNLTVTRAGIFATPNRDFSQEYLPGKLDGYGQNVMPVYMSLQEPFDSREISATMVRRLQGAGIYDQVYAARDHWSLYDNEDDGSNPFVDKLKAMGFDGAIFNESDEDGNEQTTYMAFESTQVKSATGNLGTFSQEDGRLSFSTRAELLAGADAIKAMSEEQRDDLEPAKAPGGWQAYALYEARKILPKPSDKLKKLTERNSFILHHDNDYLANVAGTHYGINKWDDPDATGEEDEGKEPFVFAYNRLDVPRATTVGTMTADVDELMDILRQDAWKIQNSSRELGFYSELAKQISQASMKQAPAAEWKSFIKALSQKGVKADEVEWSGVNDWLDLQTGKVAKQDIVTYLENSGVQVNEVVLGKSPEVENVYSIVEEGDGYNVEAGGTRLFPDPVSYEEASDSIEEMRGNDEASEPDPTKYGQYTLPGGSNYREVLLTLPIVKASVAAELKEAEKLFMAAQVKMLAVTQNKITNQDEIDQINSDYESLEAKVNDLSLQVRDAKKAPAYISSHWDQKNVLAHLRVNDRTDAEGASVLFVEEVQSDMGQDGKKKGFASNGKLPEGWSAHQDTKTREWYVVDKTNTQTGLYAATKEEAIANATGSNSLGVPQAPFVTTTQGWLNLALKRAIVMAVQGGYDKVAFVNGEQSAERYSLGGQIDTLLFDPGDGRVIGRKDGGNVVTKSVEHSGEIADLVGKEVAERLLASPKNGYGMHEISGVDLKMGGEGMIAFYDKIVPNAVSALLKKLGGGKLEMVEISDGAQPGDRGPGGVVLGPNTKSEMLQQTGFTITPAMRTKVDAGVPLFSARAQTETPAFKKWFGDSKVVDKDGKPLVVYHGTDQFDKFADEDGEAISQFDGYLMWFAKDQRTASGYATSKLRAANIEGNAYTGSPASYPVYVSIQKPVRLLFDLNAGPKMARSLAKQLGADVSAFDEAEFAYEIVNSSEFSEAAQAKGFDGVMGKEEGEMTYAVFSPTQIKSTIGNNGNFDGTNPDIRYSVRSGTSTWDMDAASKFDDIKFKLQDKHVDTKRVIQSITRYVGQVADDLNVYLQEELFHGRAAKRTEDFASQELKPLMQAIAKTGYSMADVEEYLHARHAREANRIIAQRNPGDPNMQDGGSGMTTAAAAAYLAALSPTEVQKLGSLAAQVDAIIAQTRQMYVDYGLESQRTVTAWGQMFQHYIPLMREDKDGPGGMGIGQGFSVKGKETRGRTGSKRKVVDVLANIAMQRERLIVRGEKNRVSKALYGLVRANPNPEFWEVGAPPSTRVYDPKTNTVVNRIDPMYKNKDNVLVTKVEDYAGNIVEQAVRFNEDDPRALRMAAALKNLDAGQLEGLLGVSAMITRYFAASVTQWSPIFGIVNLVRDVQGAMINLGGTPLAKQKARIAKDTLSALTGIYADIRAERNGQPGTSPWSHLFEEFQQEGGQTGFRDMFKSSADRAEDLAFTLNPDKWADSTVGKMFTAGGRLKTPMTAGVRGARVIFDWLSDYNNAMENGVRLASYKAGLDQGMSKQQAASLAKNLTVNFNRKGDVGLQTGAVYAFFNAAMQGTARMGETLFDMEPGKPKTIKLSSTGKKVVYGGVLLGSMQAFALMAAGFDDDEPPEFLRERALIIPTGWTGAGPEKGYISIPMPLGFHVIPGIGRNLTEFALSGFENPAQRATSMIAMFADAFNPIGNAGLSLQTIAPTAIDPLAALSENRDWTGKPIARTSSNKAIPGHTQWKDTATSWSKAFAEGINWATGGNEYVSGVLSPTPDQIDYLLAQLTGGVGREISKLEQSVRTGLSGEELPVYKVPLLGRFIGNSSGQASQAGVFYSNSDKLNAIETEVKGLRKDGKHDEANALLKAHPEATMVSRINVAERQIQRLRREKRELIKQGAERALVKTKETQITEVMLRVNTAMERFKETAPTP